MSDEPLMRRLIIALRGYRCPPVRIGPASLRGLVVCGLLTSHFDWRLERAGSIGGGYAQRIFRDSLGLGSLEWNKSYISSSRRLTPSRNYPCGTLTRESGGGEVLAHAS